MLCVEVASPTSRHQRELYTFLAVTKHRLLSFRFTSCSNLEPLQTKHRLYKQYKATERVLLRLPYTRSYITALDILLNSHFFKEF